MTNYDYTQYDAAAARRDELKAVFAAAELIDYDSIFDDGDFGIHKSRPVKEEDENDDDDNDDDNKMIERTPEAFSQASQKVKRSPGSKIIRLLFGGTKAKGGINAPTKEAFATTPDTDVSSRQLNSPPFSNNPNATDETPIVTNSTFGRRTPSLAEPPVIPIASPHIAPRKVRAAKQLHLMKKISAIADGAGSSSEATSEDTARLTDEDTSYEDEVNSTDATREPKEIAIKDSDSSCANDDAAQLIFMENVVNYNSFFSSDSNADKREGKSISRTPSSDVHNGSVYENESIINGSTSFGTVDSIILNGGCSCDPCGIGEMIDDVGDAIQEIVGVFNPIAGENAAEKRSSENNRSKGSITNSHGESKPRRMSTVNRYKHVKSKKWVHL